MNAVPYFRRPNQNISGLNRIPDPGFDPGVRFPFFLIETPSITGQKLFIDIMAATVYERDNYSGEIYLVLPTSFIRPCGL